MSAPDHSGSQRTMVTAKWPTGEAFHFVVTDTPDASGQSSRYIHCVEMNWGAAVGSTGDTQQDIAWFIEAYEMVQGAK